MWSRTRKKRKGLKRKSISRKSALQDRRIEREGFASSLKKRATQGVSPTATMGGRDARKEKNDEMRKERKTLKGKKNGIRKKRKDGGKLRQSNIRKTKLLLCYLSILCPLLWMLLTYLYFCIRVRGVCPCVVSACLDIRDFYTCLLRLPLPAFHEIS